MNRSHNPRTQVEGELAEIRYTLRQREAYLARLDVIAPEQQRGIDRLRAIEARLLALQAAIVKTYDGARDEDDDFWEAGEGPSVAHELHDEAASGGRAARLAGKPLAANPWPPSSLLHVVWARAWHGVFIAVDLAVEHPQPQEHRHG